MTVEQTYATLNTLLFKLLAYDNKKDREYAYKRAVGLLKILQKDHEKTILLLDDVSKRILPVIHLKEDLEKRLTYLEIAAEDNMEEYKKIMSKMERAARFKRGDE